jgi:flagellar motor switch protein FliG
MNTEKEIVITAYGHAGVIDRLGINVFGSAGFDAKTYCDILNRLELRDNSWVYARIVSEDAEYPLDFFFPLKFDVIAQLDDPAIQKIMREGDFGDLAKALKGAPEPVKERFFSNMSERAAGMLQEDMEFMGPVALRDVEAAREKTVNLIRRLAETGEITIPKG